MVALLFSICLHTTCTQSHTHTISHIYCMPNKKLQSKYLKISFVMIICLLCVLLPRVWATGRKRERESKWREWAFSMGDPLLMSSIYISRSPLSSIWVEYFLFLVLSFPHCTSNPCNVELLDETTILTAATSNERNKKHKKTQTYRAKYFPCSRVEYLQIKFY